jgi:hypothetical protein
MDGRVERARDAATDVVRRSPGTSTYLFVLLVTTAVVRSTSPALSNELLRQVSTNLEQMSRSTVRVLFLSGFLLGSSSFVIPVVMFALIYVPLERWVGTWQWLCVVIVGHVGATFVTTFGIWADVRSHRGTTALVQAIDVGPSYGLMAGAGFLLAGLPWPRVRIAALIAFLAYLALPFTATSTFTDTGHAAAGCIGIAMWLLTPADRATAPLVSPLPRSWSTSSRSSTLRPVPDRTAP